MKAVTLLSGGLDSTVLAYSLVDGGYELYALGFNYGQRHSRELKAAESIANEIGAPFRVVSLLVDAPNLGYYPLSSILGGSSLVDSSVAVPDGHYAHENMKQTIVPNRNAIMLSVAYGVAIAQGADLVAFAAHAGDHAIYPDCRPEFVSALEEALNVGSNWDNPIRVRGPFLQKSKADIVMLGSQLGVPFSRTWSCYKGGEIHCGTCGTCYERREAFQLAGVRDPTRYFDDTTTFEDPTSGAGENGASSA